MKLSHLDGILWVAGFVANCVLFVILWYRRRLARFPIFGMFIAFSATRTLILFTLWSASQWNTYRVAYWGFMIIDTVLQFGLVWETAGNVFRKRDVWVRDVSRRLVIWCLASVTVASVLTALQQSSGHGWLQSAVLRADFFPSVLISELFVVMLALSYEAGLNWKSHVASITLGLAAFSFPAVIIDTINDFHGFDAQGHLDGALQTGRKELYIACVAYWCFSLWQPEPEPRIMSPRMQGQVSALRDAVVKRNANWNE